MRTIKRLCLFTALAFIISVAATPHTLVRAVGDDRAEVRSSVRRIFDQLKSRQYDALYDSLSESSRKRVTRQRFITSMQKWDDVYQIDRVEVGAVSVRGNQAVANTVIYGRMLKPSEGEGKIVAQQTLVREQGEWRVASASTGAGLSGRTARIYLKRDGRWVDITAAMRSAGGRRRG
jgi:hypothetical protein